MTEIKIEADAGRLSIMLEVAEATAEYEMWERRWRALNQMYALERCFADRDGRWGLRDFLEYAGAAMGFEPAAPAPSSPVLNQKGMEHE